MKLQFKTGDVVRLRNGFYPRPIEVNDNGMIYCNKFWYAPNGGYNFDGDEHELDIIEIVTPTKHDDVANIIKIGDKMYRLSIELLD